MLVRPSLLCIIPISYPAVRRCLVRACSPNDESPATMESSILSNSEPPSSVVQRNRGTSSRRSGRKLKKSKTMQAFAAALSSKPRESSSHTTSGANSMSEEVSLPAVYHDGASSDGEVEYHHLPEVSREPAYPATKQEHFENDPDDFCVLPKPMYIVSDCTGESAARTVRAALNQFQTSIQTHCPATLLMHRFVDNEERVQRLVKDAAKENALVVFTLVDPELVGVLQRACALYEVKSVDLWSNLLDIMEDHLDVLRSVLPLNHPNRESKRSLNAEYFRRIEAVEYTRKMDDGAHPQLWKDADIILLGVSRSGKTPLSIFLGQRGYKVANLPLIPNCIIPAELYEIDQSKIFGLIIEPKHLMKIRECRMGSMGVQKDAVSMYAELKGISEELQFAQSLYQKNPTWPVLDVTCMGVEETAARIQRVLTERHGPEEPILFFGNH